MTILLTALALALPLDARPLATIQAGGPDVNFTLDAAEIERRLASQPFQILAMEDNRWKDDRTQRAALRFDDGTVLGVKWARAAEGGSALNNQPHYEIAAYRLQALFLDREDWVVPPTVLRVVPLEVYRQLEPSLEPTFEGTGSVLVVLQYWLEHVEPLLAPDLDRAADDEAYARRLANLNLLTHLIRHADSNTGNVLISKVGEPRMYAVDNGVAFESPESPRGTLWKDLHVRRLPAGAVERLRRLTRERLDSELAVVAELEVGPDGRLEPSPSGQKHRPLRAVSVADGTIQIGLSARELDALWARIQDLLRRVDAGQITTY